MTTRELEVKLDVLEERVKWQQIDCLYRFAVVASVCALLAIGAKLWAAVYL
jgi:hypothetical protein